MRIARHSTRVMTSHSLSGLGSYERDRCLVNFGTAATSIAAIGSCQGIIVAFQTIITNCPHPLNPRGLTKINFCSPSLIHSAVHGGKRLSIDKKGSNKPNVAIRERLSITGPTAFNPLRPGLPRTKKGLDAAGVP